MPDRLKATCRLPYGRHVYSKGEEFIASSVDAKVLVAIGKAERADDCAQPAALLTKVVEPVVRVDAAPGLEEFEDVNAHAVIEQSLAETERAAIDAAIVAPAKRKPGRPRKGEYNRRDLRAEE